MFVPRPDPPKPIFKRAGRPPGKSTAQIRECKRHGLIEHHSCSQGPGKPRRWVCKRCMGEAVTRRHQKIRAVLVAEAGGKCLVCGYARFASALQFHHVDPSTKEFAVNAGNGKALAKFRREARKCVLVCANCHVEIEGGITPCPPLSACWGERASAGSAGGA
jgi:hypothetical protein